MFKILPEKLEEKILVFLLVAMTLILGIQIVARYIVGSSLSWSEELVRYMFVWSAFVGVPYCIKLGNSLKITQFLSVIPKNNRVKIILLDKIIMLIFFAIMLFYGIIVTKTALENGQKSPALGLPIWLVYLSVVVGAFLSICRLIEKIYTYDKDEANSIEF